MRALLDNLGTSGMRCQPCTPPSIGIVGNCDVWFRLQNTPTRNAARADVKCTDWKIKKLDAHSPSCIPFDALQRL